MMTNCHHLPVYLSVLWPNANEWNAWSDFWHTPYPRQQ